MRVDFHTHPVLVEEFVGRDENLARACREQFGLRTAPQPLEVFLRQMDCAGVAKAVILPVDAVDPARRVFSNEQVAELIGVGRGRLVGFASVDPHRPDGRRILRWAATELGLKGLKLNPLTQEFDPVDRDVAYPLYAEAEELGIPVLFHAGMSWSRGFPLHYAHPLQLERVAIDFPSLAVVIAHLGWPWTMEACCLAIRRQNVYLDTAALYTGTPAEFMRHVGNVTLPPGMLERELRHKLLFGSNYPRVEMHKMATALEELGWREDSRALVFGGNAVRLLGLASGGDGG